MTAGGLEIPAQTITMSSDQLGKELADRLRKSLERYRVYRSGFYVRLQHLACLEILRTTARTTLLQLVQLAMEHQCDPETGSPQ